MLRPLIGIARCPDLGNISLILMLCLMACATVAAKGLEPPAVTLGGAAASMSTVRPPDPINAHLQYLDATIPTSSSSSSSSAGARAGLADHAASGFNSRPPPAPFNSRAAGPGARDPHPRSWEAVPLRGRRGPAAAERIGLPR